MDADASHRRRPQQETEGVATDQPAEPPTANQPISEKKTARAAAAAAGSSHGAAGFHSDAPACCFLSPARRDAPFDEPCQRVGPQPTQKRRRNGRSQR